MIRYYWVQNIFELLLLDFFLGFYFVFFNIVKILIGFTYAPLAPDTYGCTPIHYAAANGNLDTTKFLVGLKDTPNALDNHGNTPN